MREPQKKIIDGLEYTVTPLGAGAGLPVMTELAQQIAPALAGITRLDQLGEEESAIPALRELLSKLDGHKLIRICATFAEQATVQIAPDKAPSLAKIFDVHFAANYMSLFEFMLFAAEVNGFGSFLRQLLARSRGARPASTPSPSASPPVSSGGSGVSQSAGDFIPR